MSDLRAILETIISSLEDKEGIVGDTPEIEAALAVFEDMLKSPYDAKWTEEHVRNVLGRKSVMVGNEAVEVDPVYVNYEDAVKLGARIIAHYETWIWWARAELEKRVVKVGQSGKSVDNDGAKL